MKTDLLACFHEQNICINTIKGLLRLDMLKSKIGLNKNHSN